MVIGKLWVEHHGRMEIINHKTGHKSEIAFKKSNMFSREVHRIEGSIFDNRRQRLLNLYGSWTDSVFSVEPHQWDVHVKPETKLVSALWCCSNTWDGIKVIALYLDILLISETPNPEALCEIIGAGNYMRSPYSQSNDLSPLWPGLEPKFLFKFDQGALAIEVFRYSIAKHIKMPFHWRWIWHRTMDPRTLFWICRRHDPGLLLSQPMVPNLCFRKRLSVLLIISKDPSTRPEMSDRCLVICKRRFDWLMVRGRLDPCCLQQTSDGVKRHLWNDPFPIVQKLTLFNQWVWFPYVQHIHI